MTGNGTTQNDVPLADVAVTREMTGTTTTLTKEAATVLGSASYEGAAGDPLTVAAGAGVVVAVRRRRTAWNG